MFQPDLSLAAIPQFKRGTYEELMNQRFHVEESALPKRASTLGARA